MLPYDKVKGMASGRGGQAAALGLWPGFPDKSNRHRSNQPVTPDLQAIALGATVLPPVKDWGGFPDTAFPSRLVPIGTGRSRPEGARSMPAQRIDRSKVKTLERQFPADTSQAFTGPAID